MHTNFALIEILSLLGIAVLMATLFGRLGFGAILGYLTGGVLIGPSGLGIIDDPTQTAHLGEFGIVFLLFMIGLELKPARLWTMRRQIFGSGSAQLILSGVLLAALAYWLLEQPSGVALLIGFGLALSSTAFDLQILVNENLIKSRWGRSSFSILLLQDLAVVPLLALVPVLAQESLTLGPSLLYVTLEVMLLLAGSIVIGKLAINPLFRVVAANKVPEVFTAMALLLVLGFGWLMSAIGLSMAMGAFIAGLLMSQSEFRHQVEIDIKPFRGLLLGLFFMSVGMGIDTNVILQNGALIGILLLGLLASKAFILLALTRVMHLTLPEAVKSAFLLAQAGEFGFVLFSYAALEGVIVANLSSILISVIALSMAVTPALFFVGNRISARMAGAGEPAPDRQQGEGEEDEGPKVGAVIIAGFGRVGETVAFVLSNLHIPFVAVDLDPENVKRARELGYDAIFGDASHPDITDKAGAATAPLLVITLNDSRAAERLLTSSKKRYPKLKIFMRSHDNFVAEKLLTHGADHVIPETLEASLALGGDVARALDAKDDSIVPILRSLRRSDYTLLLNKVQH